MVKPIARRKRVTEYEPQREGWYIFVWVQTEWRPLLDLLFAREADARRAVATLTANGLDSYNAMTRAGVERVKQVATEFLWW